MRKLDRASADQIHPSKLTKNLSDILYRNGYLFYLLQSFNKLYKGILMNKAELVEQIARITKLPKGESRAFLEAFISAVGSALKQNKSVVLTGFGTFSVMKRKSRTGINPVTKKKMTIPAKKVPKFKAGKSLKSMIK